VLVFCYLLLSFLSQHPTSLRLVVAKGSERVVDTKRNKSVAIARNGFVPTSGFGTQMVETAVSKINVVTRMSR